jgi:hypothetical protein
MAHQPKGQHWRTLGKADVSAGADKSTAAILGKLGTLADGARPVVESHAGISSLNTDGGKKPTAPRYGDNVDANAKFNQSTKGPRERGNVVMVGK